MAFSNIVQTVGNVQGAIGAVKNIVQTVLSLSAQDVVAIYDNTTVQQVFKNARPVKANVARSAKIMEHPIESGAVVQDFMILQPVEVELSLIVTGEDYFSTYSQIYDYWRKGLPVIVQTRAGVIRNMLIQAMPHEETPDMFDVIPVALKLRQMKLVKIQYKQLQTTQVKRPSDASTVNTGAQQPQQSALYQIGSFVKGII